MKNEKTRMAIVIILLMAVIMVLTVPEKKQHKEKMMAAMKEFVDEECSERFGDNILTGIGKSVVLKTAETALNSKLKVKNFYLFNTTYVRLNGEDHTLSLGLLGMVFTFDKEMLHEKLEEALKAKEEAADEKKAAKQSARELKRLEKEKRRMEKKQERERKKAEKAALKEKKRQEKAAAKEAKRKAKEEKK